MRNKNWKRVLIGGAVGLALMAGTVWAVAPTAYAQAEPDAITGETTLAQFGRSGFGGRGVSGRGVSGGNELLLNALDLTRVEYQEAQQAAWEIAVERAVAEGELTQEAADALLAGEGRGLRGRGVVDVTDADLAEALGMTEAELESARDGAVDQGVEDGLLTEAQANELRFQQLMRDAMQAARETAIQQGVEQGLISQAQADQMLSEEGRGFGGFGPGQIGRGGPGGRGNFGGANGFPGMGRNGGPGRGQNNGTPVQPDTDTETTPENTLFQT